MNQPASMGASPMSVGWGRVPSAARSWPAFDRPQLLWSVLVCVWVLSCITIAPPEDWKVSRFGTVPVLPLPVMSAIKAAGRLIALSLLGFSLLSLHAHPKFRAACRYLLPLWIFTAWSLASVLWSADKSISLPKSVTLTILIVMSTLLAIVWRRDRDTERIVRQLTFTFFAISTCLLLLHFGFPRSGSLTKNSSGIFHSTNAGATASLAIVLMVAARSLWQVAWTKRWLIPVMLVQLTVLLIAGNRLSIVMAITVVGLALAAYGSRPMLASSVLVFVVIATAYFVFDPGLQLVEYVGDFVGLAARQGQSSGELSSLSGRSEMWQKMWKSFLQSPFIGHGYFVTSPTGRMYAWYVWGNWTAHNMWLQLLTTIGLIGLLLLLWAFMTLGVGTVRGVLCSTDCGKTGAMLLLLTVWFLGWGCLNESLFGPLQPESVVIAIVFGLAAGIGSTAARSGTRPAALLETPANGVLLPEREEPS